MEENVAKSALIGKWGSVGRNVGRLIFKTLSIQSRAEHNSSSIAS